MLKPLESKADEELEAILKDIYQIWLVKKGGYRVNSEDADKIDQKMDYLRRKFFKNSYNEQYLEEFGPLNALISKLGFLGFKASDFFKENL